MVGMLGVDVFGSRYSSNLKLVEPTVQGKRIHKGPSNNPSNLQKRVSSKPRHKSRTIHCP